MKLSAFTRVSTSVGKTPPAWWELGVIRLNCPVPAVSKGAGGGGVGYLLKGQRLQGRVRWMEAWMAPRWLQGNRGTLQCLWWPHDVSQMQKYSSGWCSSGVFLANSSKDHLLHAERQFHIGYRCYHLLGQFWLVKSIRGGTHIKILMKAANFSVWKIP